MEKALRELLQRLEAIEADYDGLGDTNVREHMMADIFDGFLRPRKGFTPSGEYGLDAKANALVAEILGQFCAAATVAAKKSGLKTFHQRLEAFQDPDISTPDGAEIDDYFGTTEPSAYEESGERRRETIRFRPTAAAAKISAYEFDRPGSLEDLMRAANQASPWKWHLEGDPKADQWMEVKPEPGTRLRIRQGLETLEQNGSTTPPERGFFAKLEAAAKNWSEADRAFREMLANVGARDLTEASAFDW